MIKISGSIAGLGINFGNLLCADLILPGPRLKHFNGNNPCRKKKQLAINDIRERFHDLQRLPQYVRLLSFR
jgi:hypothetical protein